MASSFYKTTLAQLHDRSWAIFLLDEQPGIMGRRLLRYESVLDAGEEENHFLTKTPLDNQHDKKLLQLSKYLTDNPHLMFGGKVDLGIDREVIAIAALSVGMWLQIPDNAKGWTRFGAETMATAKGAAHIFNLTEVQASQLARAINCKYWVHSNAWHINGTRYLLDWGETIIDKDLTKIKPNEKTFGFAFWGPALLHARRIKKLSDIDKAKRRVQKMNLSRYETNKALITELGISDSDRDDLIIAMQLGGLPK